MPEDAYTTPVEVRFRDLDTEGHVNNAVYATYLEQARAAFYREVVGVELTEAPTVIVHLEVDYRAPIEADDEVTVALTVPELGESSVPMEYEVRVGDRIAATAETVQVTWDREAGESIPIPEGWRRNVESYFGL